MAITATKELAALYASTWEKVKAQVVNQVFEATPGMVAFLKKGRVAYQNGGTHVTVQLEYERNPSVQWIDMNTGLIDTTKHDPLTENQFTWAVVGGTVWARHVHASQNAGPYQIFKLQEAFTNNVKNTVSYELEAALFGKQTGNSPYGLQDLVSDNPTAGTVGLVNRTVYPWYRNGAKDCSSRPFSVYGRTDMRTAFMTIQKFGNPKDLVILTDADTYALYEDEVGEKLMITNKDMADIGFEHTAYRGSPLIWSPQCPAGHMYFLDMQYITLTIHSGVNMAIGDWIPDQGNIDLAAHVLTQCVFSISRPKSTYVLYGLAA